MIVCAMIAGPGEAYRYMDRMLRYASDWADVLCLSLDGADKDTRDCAVYHSASFENGGHVSTGERIYERDGEGAARNRLFRLLDRVLDEGDLVVSIDADEQLTTPRLVLKGLDKNLDEGAGVWKADYWHLWTRSGDKCRADGLWYPDKRHMAWRHIPGARTEEGGLFAESTPMQARESKLGRTALQVNHWGYSHIEDRREKHELYMRRDGGHQHNVDHLESIVANPELVVLP
jgi:glycosyltransferase involved in cell wall biosynthesis